MIETDRLVSRVFASFGGKFGRRLTAAGLDTRDRMYHGASDTRPFYSEREFQFGDLIRCNECPPGILVIHRSPGSLSRLKQGFARPGPRPKLVGLRPA